MTDRIASWYNTDILSAREEHARRFWRGEGRYCMSMPFCSTHWYRQLFDEERMLTEAARWLEAIAGNPGMNFPTFYADLGTITTAKYWGGKVRPATPDCNIFIAPAAETLEEALALTPLPVDHPHMDAARAIRLYQQLCTRLDSDLLWLRTPDFQGVLNTAGMVLEQEEFFVSLYSQPDEAHTFLERICSHLIDFGNYLRTASAGKLCGGTWPDIFFPPELGMMWTEDMMPLLSAPLYREFGIPAVQRMDAAFGGCCLHCCGAWGQHVPALRTAGLTLRAVEFHYPLTRIEEIAPLTEQSVFLPFIILDQQTIFRSQTDYFRYLIEETDPAYRYWFNVTEDTPDAQAFLAEFWHD